jgi:hypothetical protein
MSGGMLGTIVLRSLLHRPWRSALLFGGFGLGVGVMIVLLSIGEAMLAQARDERLVGGGEITVLPEGIDVEVMKTGGAGGLFFSIDNARFLALQLFASPRLASDVRAVAPQIEGKLLYLRPPGGGEIAVRATGELPTATRLVGGAPALAAGRWEDDSLDRRWRAPTPAELRHDIDHFHVTPPSVAEREAWGEWHYFNVLSADRRRWAFISFILGGDIPNGRWGGQVLVTLHAEGAPPRRFSASFPATSVRFSTTDADLSLAGNGVTVLPDGQYAVHATAHEEGGGGDVRVDLTVAPAPGAYFPGASLGSDGFVSGYAVPGLRADADGSICVGGRCERFAGAQAYHDHNWGVWRGVSWEWGAARAGSYTFLYGRVTPPDSAGADAPLFFYLVDSLGFRALFRPRRIAYEDGRVVTVAGQRVRTPTRAVLADVRGDDTLRVELTIEDAAVTDTRRPTPERGEGLAARHLVTPFFVQMKGTATIGGRIGGKPLTGQGAGFFETYR